MDLGINGRKAIVCGGSSGLGKAIAAALSGEGVVTTIVARDAEKLKNSATEIATNTGHEVDYLSVDLANPEQRDTLKELCAATDILINNSGGPPPGDFRNLTRDDWLAALESNMLSAIDLMNATIPGMCDRQFGRIINVTSHMVKQPNSMLSLSNGARAGLTGYVGGIARDLARYNVTINNMLPGQFETERLRSNHVKFAASRGVSVEEYQQSSKKAIPTQRFGQPEEFGAYAAFLCSDLAGYVTGQNLMLDGGQYPGMF